MRMTLFHPTHSRSSRQILLVTFRTQTLRHRRGTTRLSSLCPQIRTSRPIVSISQSDRMISYLFDIRRRTFRLQLQVREEHSRKDWASSTRPPRALSEAGLTLSPLRSSIKRDSAIFPK